MELVFTNAEYDEDQVKTSSKLAQSQAESKPDFVFVNFDYGDEDQKRSTRKVIRSQATAYSHRVAPRGASKPEVSLRVIRNAENEGPLLRRPSVESTFSGSSTSSRRSQKCWPKDSPPSAKVVMPKQDSPPDGAANISRKRKRRRSRSADSHASDRSLSPGAFASYLPDPVNMNASMRDPFNTYPVRYRNWYGQLINFWYHVVLPRATRVLKATRAELDNYTIWSRRHELGEPALFYTTLYLASGIPVAEGLFPVKAAMWLRHKAVQAMKEALADPERALSTAVISAVGRIALHEHIYGNRELAHTVHRPAQLCMINMRGGLANMGLPATTIQLVVWTDALLSGENGTPPFFADVPKQMAIQGYTAEEAMHVTNHCSPKRYAHPGYENQGTVVPEPPE